MRDCGSVLESSSTQFWTRRHSPADPVVLILGDTLRFWSLEFVSRSDRHFYIPSRCLSTSLSRSVVQPCASRYSVSGMSRTFYHVCIRCWHLVVDCSSRFGSSGLDSGSRFSAARICSWIGFCLPQWTLQLQKRFGNNCLHHKWSRLHVVDLVQRRLWMQDQSVRNLILSS
jgi:hypothetical protein